MSTRYTNGRSGERDIGVAPYTHICARCRHPITAHRIDPRRPDGPGSSLLLLLRTLRVPDHADRPRTPDPQQGRLRATVPLVAATAAADSDPSPLTVTEDSTTFCPLVFGGPADVAVVVSRVGQAAWLRAVLADVAGVLVGTANGLQGVERPVVVAVHPLAGCRGGGEGFGLDSGRLCVMLSRHRAHLSVLVDAGSAAVLDRLAAEGSGGDGAVARSRWVWEALAAAPVF